MSKTVALDFVSETVWAQSYKLCFSTLNFELYLLVNTTLKVRQKLNAVFVKTCEPAG